MARTLLDLINEVLATPQTTNVTPAAGAPIRADSVDDEFQAPTTRQHQPASTRDEIRGAMDAFKRGVKAQEDFDSATTNEGIRQCFKLGQRASEIRRQMGVE